MWRSSLIRSYTVFCGIFQVASFPHTWPFTKRFSAIRAIGPQNRIRIFHSLPGLAKEGEGESIAENTKMGPFKVAIVGGGMTGLTAALHLDRLGIDFVLLEAYSDITPEVGASLALYPNFQRVLDQLGVMDDVREVSTELRSVKCRNLEGRVMFEHHIAGALHEATEGYGIATFTRSSLLKILYKNISEEGKRKIRTNTRVKSIEQLQGNERIRLHVENEEPIDADVVIGADGIHSIVRSEMWRLAREVDPKAFEGDQAEGESRLLLLFSLYGNATEKLLTPSCKDMATEFGCVYGLSTPTGDMDKHYGYQVSTEDMSIGLFGGPKGEAFWFLFFRVDDAIAKLRGRDTVPKWTFEQGVEICKKYANAKITDSVTFADVYKNQFRLSAPQACPNHCLRRWTYGRIICLGDSVAKTNPILAQGGAQGAESVLQLVDQLHEALQNQKNQDATRERLSTIEVEGILMSVNKERQPRVSGLVDNSQLVMRISAWSGWVFWFIGKYLTPWLPTSVIVAQALAPWKGAYVSKSLPVPMPPAEVGGIKAY